VPYVPDSQGAALFFNGQQLGVLQNVRLSVAVGNKHEVTSMRSPVTGSASSARVMKQYNVTSIEPGTITAVFLGLPDLVVTDVGKYGLLVFNYGYGSRVSAQAFLESLDSEFAKGELAQWAAVFQLSGA
jgi:23S rRNA G2445 N2-methylase RlmL